MDKLPNKETFTGVGREETNDYIYEGEKVDGKIQGHFFPSLGG